jgi:hypothetical protein
LIINYQSSVISHQPSVISHHRRRGEGAKAAAPGDAADASESSDSRPAKREWAVEAEADEAEDAPLLSSRCCCMEKATSLEPDPILIPIPP